MGISNPGAAGASINPTQRNAEKQLNAREAIKDIQSGIDAMESATQIFDSEAQGVNAKMVKGQLDGEGHQGPKQADSKEARNTSGLDAYAASVAATDELEKKKKAKKLQTFSEKMETLESMGEVIDPENVPEEEKGIFQTFLKNLGTIKQLRKKLKDLKREREALEAQLESMRVEMKRDNNSDNQSDSQNKGQK